MDYYLLTHFHDDHDGMLDDTLLSCEVGSVHIKEFEDRWTYECIDDLG